MKQSRSARKVSAKNPYPLSGVSYGRRASEALSHEIRKVE